MRAPGILTLAAAMLAATACRDAAGPGGVAVYMRFGGPEPRVQAGSTLQLTATALDVRERPVADVEIGYRSEQPEIATVDATGRVTGVSPGGTRITAWAGKAHGFVGLVVEPRGGVRVARFALLPPDSIRRATSVDTWSLSTPVLRFAAANAQGVSLCGHVPLQLSVRDPGMLAAAHTPGGDPCAIRLSPADGPADEDSTVLRASMGGVNDSVKVYIHRTRFRVAFGPDPFNARAVAGDTVYFRLGVVGADGRPVSGAPVTAVIHNQRTGTCCAGSCCTGPAVDSVQAVTGADGTLRLAGRAPTSTLGSYVHTIVQRRSEWPTLLAAVTIDLGSRGTLHQSSELDVYPGPGTRIAVFQEAGFDWTWRRQWHWVEALGDTVHSGIPVTFYPGQCVRPWLGAAALDRYGNPTTRPPDVAGEGIGTRVTDFRSEYFEGYYEAGSGFENGYITTFGLSQPTGTAQVTITYPGLPPRTITMVTGPTRC
ncbi:MAG TPA: Ig-like domain-containing protein [Longimicrobium sp.]|nr:Ig-like domain-containing protein [Longimicrobium sp.]